MHKRAARVGCNPAQTRLANRTKFVFLVSPIRPECGPKSWGDPAKAFEDNGRWTNRIVEFRGMTDSCSAKKIWCWIMECICNERSMMLNVSFFMSLQKRLKCNTRQLLIIYSHLEAEGGAVVFLDVRLHVLYDWCNRFFLQLNQKIWKHIVPVWCPRHGTIPYRYGTVPLHSQYLHLLYGMDQRLTFGYGPATNN